MDMAKLARALLARALPGKSPEMDVPERSVMEGGPESSLGSFRQGGGRGLLDILGGAWDIPVQAANALPGLPGLVLRTAAGGKSKLPTDAVAEATGLAGKGAAYEAGRASVNALAALGARKVNMELPGPGTLNMFIGPWSPGYNFGAVKEVVRRMKENGLLDTKNLDHFAIGHAVKNQGFAYDPAARKILQRVDSSQLRTSPGHFNDIRNTLQNGGVMSFEDLFDYSGPVKSQLPKELLRAKVKFDKGMIYGAHYTPAKNLLTLSHESLSPDGANFRNHVFHEGQHAVQSHEGIAGGSSVKTQARILLQLMDYQDARNLRDTEHNRKIFDRSTWRYEGGRDIDGILRGARPPNNPLRNHAITSSTRTPYNAYRADIGELFAFEAGKQAKELRPLLPSNRGFNIYSEEANPTDKGLSVEVLERNARGSSLHPTLWNKVAGKYPELMLPYNRAVTDEMAGYSGLMGLDRGEFPSPLFNKKFAGLLNPPKGTIPVLPAPKSGQPPEMTVENSSPSKPMPSPESAPRPKPERVFPESHEDAMKLMEQGFQLFAFHEMGGGKIPITSVDMLNAYAPDQIMALKRSKGIAVPLPKSKN